MKNPFQKLSGSPGETVEQRIIRRTLVSFAVFFVLMGAAYIGWRRLYNQPMDNEVQRSLRTGMKVNEKIFGTAYSTKHLAKSFSIADAVRNVRVNGDVGLDTAGFNPADWRLKVLRKNGDTLSLTMADIRALPKTEVVFDFKCIEGWSQVTYWGGVRFSDFARHYDLMSETGLKYTGLITPDEQYYVGVDMPAMMQPQTILCYEMNGQPLPMDQGYPLRLIIPVKYGIKHLKRIGTMYFADERPKDYWAEKGYDYYSGL